MTFKSKGFLGGCVIDVDLHEFTIVSFVQSWILTWATLCHMHLRFDPFCDYLKTFKVLFFLKFFLSCDWGICFNHDLEVLHCHVQWICHSIMGFGLLWAQTSTLIMSLVNSIVRCCGLWWAHCFLMSLKCTIVTQYLSWFPGFSIMRLLSWGRFRCQHKYWSICEESLMGKWVDLGPNQYGIKKVIKYPKSFKQPEVLCVLSKQLVWLFP